MGIFSKRPLLAACAVFLAAGLCGIAMNTELRRLGMLVFGIGILPALACMLCFPQLRRGFSRSFSACPSASERFSCRICSLTGRSRRWKRNPNP